MYVVVLNYDGRDHLGYCLQSLGASDYPNYRIVVVDNASTDGSAEMVLALCPAARMIRSSTNRGWSGGNNLGIREALAADARYIVLANNDIRVNPRWLRAAVEVAENDPEIGVVGFQIVLQGNPVHDPGLEPPTTASPAISISSPRYVSGAAMCVRSEVFSCLGLIDEGFFAYCEENDLQIRVRKAGYRIVVINIPIWHYGQGAFGKIPRRAAILQARGNIRLIIKHGSFTGIISSALAHLVRCIVSPLRDRPRSAVERRLAYSNLATNLAILAWGLGWNVWKLPNTLRRRFSDNRRAAAVYESRLVR